MASEAGRSEPVYYKNSRTWGRIAFIWLLVLSALLLWQAVVYGPLVDRFAEWQFGMMGRYFPALTYLVFVLIAGVPVALHFLMRWREARLTDNSLAGGGRAIATSGRWMSAFFTLSAIALIAALGALLTAPRNSADANSVQQVDPARAGTTDFAEGPSELTGDPDFSRIAGYGQSLIFVRSDTFFAPVIASPGTARQTRFFVELKRIPGSAPRFSAPGVGMLRKNALPGEIASLFRQIGIDVEEPHYVLFQSDRFQRWRHIVLAAQLGLTGIVLAAFGLWQRRRRNTLRKVGRSPQTS